MMRGGMHHLMEVSEEKARNRRAIILRLLREIRPYWREVLLSIGLVVVSAASQGAAPYLIGRAVDQFISRGDRAGLQWTMLLLAAVYVAGMFATRFQTYFMSRAGQSMLAGMRQQVFEKLQSLSLQFLESRAAGDVMSRLVNDIDALNSFFSQALPQMIGAVFSLFGVAAAMLALDLRMGLTVIVMVPVLILVTRWFSSLARRSFRKTRETLGDVSADLEEELGGVKVAQAFNRTGENVRRFAARNAANRDANINATAVTSAFAPTMDVLSTLDTALVAAMGGALAISGQISIGVVVSFLQYVQNFFRPIQMVAQMWTMAQSALAAAERVYDLLDTRPDVTDRLDAIEAGQLRGEIAFDDVSFAYEEDQPVLEGASFHVSPGQMVAIVGPTGAGKTTLASLIARFYDVSKGRVTIDGCDVRSYVQRSLRSQMGLVTQEPFLFSGTILQNLRYGRLDATDEEVIAAARAANADDFIQKMPQGYQTEVGERGKLLSQGQRQLVAIARAILADPRILILDEATASIDTRTEVIIQKALKRLLHGRTSIVIAHRLSTVRNADLVLAINEGRIVEQGTHDSLMAQEGLYAELYRRQFVEIPQQAPLPSTAD